MGERVYLDWNATTPLRPEARAAMLAAFERFGNPSSTHTEGRAARQLIEDAREKVAALVGAEPRNVTFTSGGSEANALALSPGLAPSAGETGCGRLLLSAIEHPSVRSGGRFSAAAMATIPATAAGVIELAALREAVAQTSHHDAKMRPLVALMQANNETGIVQPVVSAAEIVHRAGGLLHVDAVQAAGKIPCQINDLGADTVAISAHKMGGPKGVGALIKRSDVLHIGEPLLKGGGQERGARGGTENLIGIAGFGAAAEAAGMTLASDATRMTLLRDQLERELAVVSPTAVIFTGEGERLPNTTMVAIPGVEATTALIALDLAGIAASAGSACSSGKVAGSAVLAAMKVPPSLATGAIRLSLGYATTAEDVAIFISAWRTRVAGLSKMKRGVAA